MAEATMQGANLHSGSGWGLSVLLKDTLTPNNLAIAEQILYLLKPLLPVCKHCIVNNSTDEMRVKTTKLYKNESWVHLHLHLVI